MPQWVVSSRLTDGSRVFYAGGHEPLGSGFARWDSDRANARIFTSHLEARAVAHLHACCDVLPA